MYMGWHIREYKTSSYIVMYSTYRPPKTLNGEQIEESVYCLQYELY